MLKHQLLHFWQEMTHCSCWRKQSGRFKAHFMAETTTLRVVIASVSLFSHLNSHDFYDISKCFNLDIKILKYMETTLVTHLTYPAQRFKRYFSPAEFHSTFLSRFSTVLLNLHFQFFFTSSSLKGIYINFWKRSSSKVLQWKFTSDQGEKRHPAYKN